MGQGSLAETLDAIESDLRLCELATRRVNVYWDTVLPHVTLDGLWLEFGVFSGRSLQYIASRSPGLVYGFDSFEGLSEDWSSAYPKGSLSLGGTIPAKAAMEEGDPQEWHPNASIVHGRVEDTIEPFLVFHKGPVAFAHFDLDVYGPTKCALSALRDRVQPGSILAFDELVYFDGPYKEHEMKALGEFLSESGYWFDTICKVGIKSPWLGATIKIKESP